MKKYKSLTEAETLVMKCIWDAEEEMSLSDVFTTVNNIYHKDWKYQTVSSFLGKLVQKGFIQSKRKGHRILYEILINQDDYKAQQTQEFVDFWNRGSMRQFLTSFYHRKTISDAEIQELRKALDELDT